jgi:hypothetical protein
MTLPAAAIAAAGQSPRNWLRDDPARTDGVDVDRHPDRSATLIDGYGFSGPRIRASSSSRRERAFEYQDTSSPMSAALFSDLAVHSIFPSSIPANMDTPRTKAERASSVCI